PIMHYSVTTVDAEVNNVRVTFHLNRTTSNNGNSADAVMTRTIDGVGSVKNELQSGPPMENGGTWKRVSRIFREETGDDWSGVADFLILDHPNLPGDPQEFEVSIKNVISEKRGVHELLHLYSDSPPPVPVIGTVVDPMTDLYFVRVEEE